MYPNFIDHLLQSLSWTFVHSLWLGLILSTIAGLIMLLTKRSAASLRYALLTGSFILFLACLIISFFFEWNAYGSEVAAQSLRNGTGETGPGFQQVWIHDMLSGFSTFLTNNSSRIVLVWSVVIFFKAIKMSFDLLSVSRLRSQQVYTPGEEWISRLQTLAGNIGINRTVTIAESAMIKVPVVIGHLKPLVLMPVGILNNLSAGEVEAVLLHELAHIKRHDYLVNLIQRISETVLFFNPAFLWVSSLMRIEREHCCDDIAIAKTENRLQFVEALISFKEYSMAPQQYAVGLFGKKSLLLHRMTRIVYKRNKTLSSFEFAFFAINIVVIFLLAVSNRKQPDREMIEYAPLTSYMQPDPAFSTKRLQHVREKAPGEKKIKPAAVKAINKKPIAEIPEKAEPVYRDNEPNTEDQKILFNLVKEQEEYKKDQRYREIQLLQAEHDRLEADLRRQQAEQHRLIAEQDRKRAEVDRAVAATHRQQAERDRLQAQKDRERAERQREEAEIVRKKQAEERRQDALSSAQHR